MIWKNLKCILPTERSLSENTKLEDSNCVLFWKRQSCGVRKYISGCQVSRERPWWLGRSQGILGILFCVMLVLHCIETVALLYRHHCIETVAAVAQHFSFLSMKFKLKFSNWVLYPGSFSVKNRNGESYMFFINVTSLPFTFFDLLFFFLNNLKIW